MPDLLPDDNPIVLDQPEMYCGMCYTPLGKHHTVKHGVLELLACESCFRKISPPAEKVVRERDDRQMCIEAGVIEIG